ncbi:hypothetical protein [Marinospirillum perlucidum]|uniref:hypothetical protein n=1 Tax=Marinospirillum perlucidum TaxID=1982602 RepID=UPI000DF4BAA8|nr:hypothetical protein [Marinospirillum perlucidum]
MKHQHAGMLVICLVMLGAGLMVVTQGGSGYGLWLLLPMLGCLVLHLVLHRKMDSDHEHKPPE